MLLTHSCELCHDAHTDDLSTPHACVFHPLRDCKHSHNHGTPCLRYAVLFIKPPSSAVLCSAPEGACRVSLPKDRGSVHYECEVILRLGPDTGIADVSLGLDLTLREVQAQLKKGGHPWEISKVR